jgi:hypothetical protein
LSQFRSIKRFHEARQIRIEDGSITEAYGAVTLQVTQGLPELDEVWYAPEFSSLKLISITTLIDKRAEVRFLPDMNVSVLYDGQPIFTGFMYNCLICLDVVASQQAFKSEASQQAPTRETAQYSDDT